MFFPVNEKNHLLKSIASIAAMRTDNIMVDDRIIPVGWLAENGVNVRIERKLSAFSDDGTIAKAGEAYYNLIHFTSEYGLDESRTIRLYGRHWDQQTVYNEILSLLDLNQRKQNEWERENQKRIEAQRLHDERMCKRDQLIGLFFEQHGKPASSFRVGQWVATRDGLIWKVSSKIHGDVELCAQDNNSTKVRVVSNDTILIPANDRITREFRSMLHGISY